jgi:sugar-phosphatase
MKAAIFDMDGLLIDSEPLWREAEVSVFRDLGVPLTTDMCRETIGIRVDGVVRHWFDRFPWQGVSLATVESRIVTLVEQLIEERGAPMPGVRQAIETLRGAGFVLAVASSSPLSLIRGALEQMCIIDEFAVLHSAEDEAQGKPHPAVYASTLSRLGVQPERCVAFEDSVAGVRSAHAAGARVIAVPDPCDIANPGFAEADAVLDSLRDFSLQLLEGYGLGT